MQRAQPEIERVVRHAGKVRVDDLDWESAARAGLSEDEAFVVQYFADIEGQTLANLKVLLSIPGTLEPAMTAFLTTWNYEEYFHGRALAQLLCAAGRADAQSRVEEVHRRARWKERVERYLVPLASRAFGAELPAVYMSFGAIHELTTLRGYERLSSIAENPLLRTLAVRIARQERRHFAFYFGRAKRELAASARARLVTRSLFRHYWAPVGAGVKGVSAVRRLFTILFPGAHGTALCADVDAHVQRLPGMQGLGPMRRYFYG